MFSFKKPNRILLGIDLAEDIEAAGKDVTLLKIANPFFHPMNLEWAKGVDL